MSNRIELSPNEEKVLQEVLDHKTTSGISDNDYWYKRFEKAEGQEKVQLRSILGVLNKKELINIPSWPDGIPVIFINNYALEYFSEKKRYLKEKKKDERKTLKREILIGFIGALLGALVSHITEIINWIKAMFNN